MRSLILVSALFSFTNLFAQLSVSEEKPSANLFEIKSAYNDGRFQAAYALITEQENSEYIPDPAFYFYKAKVEQALEHSGSMQTFQYFVKQSPAHPLADLAYLEIAHSCFNDKNYGEALIAYASVSDDLLSVEDKEEKYLKEGLSLLELDRSEEAVDKLELARSFQGTYYDQASYHLAFYYHSIEAYQQALGYLIDLESNSSTQVIMLKASILYETKKYKDLFAIGDKHLNNRSNEKNRQLSLLIGSAYFNNSDYVKAADFLQQHVDLSRRVSTETYYQLGYAQMKANRQKLAVQNLKQSGLSDRKIGQLSSFYLGKIYLDLNQLNHAYNAFKEASVLDFEPSIQEEAAFLIGKVNIDRYFFAEAINDLSAFTESFPKSKWKTEADELLAEAYLRTSDYDQAIEHLSEITRLNPALQAAFQEVNYRKGMLLLGDGYYDKAVSFLEKAAKSRSSRPLSAQSYYWLGEAFTAIKSNEQAKTAYQNATNAAVSPWNEKSTYGLAYLFYNLQQYEKAEVEFMRFLGYETELPKPMVKDASVRLADCYLVLKKYSLAIEAYKRLGREMDNPYLIYQLGVAYQLNDQQERARTQYRKVTEKPSDYHDLALFQMANSFMETGDFAKATESLSALISSGQNTQLMPYAYSKRALANFNLQKYQLASRDYSYVLENHMIHEVSNDALLGLQALIQKGITVENFEQILSDYQAAHPEDSSLEVIAFETAKGSYYNQQYEIANDQLSAFIGKYPQSGFRLDADYFLADGYYRMRDWQQATNQFSVVIANRESPYLVRSLDKRGRALLKLEKYQEAIENYRMLKSVARNSKEEFLATEGLMNTYVADNIPDSALFYANKILNAPYKPINAEQSVWMVKAKIYIDQKNFGPAMDELIKIANDSPNERAAEASYLLAKVRYLQEDYKSSLEMLFDLNRKFGSYPYWIGKSFLLIAENYYELDELLQAKATLQSIIDNSKQAEIVKQAEKRLEELTQSQEQMLTTDSVKSDSIK